MIARRVAEGTRIQSVDTKDISTRTVMLAAEIALEVEYSQVLAFVLL